MTCRYRNSALAAAILAVAIGAPIAARAVTSAPQVRHLVYSFTWGTTNDTEMHTSGMEETGNVNGMKGGTSASGMVSSTGGAADHGTIAIDVVRKQPDNGLVLTVSETAINRRSAVPAECVVYGNLTVVCDPNKKINEEELALLRMLGADFIDPNDLDAQRHWQRRQNDAISDFTIAGNANGIMTINETRQEKQTGARPLTSDVTGTIVYDFNRTVPTSIHEYTEMRSEQGEQYQTVKTETALELVSDTSQTPH